MTIKQPPHACRFSKYFRGKRCRWLALTMTALIGNAAADAVGAAQLASDCRVIPDDVERLACYDLAHRHEAGPADVAPAFIERNEQRAMESPDQNGETEPVLAANRPAGEAAPTADHSSALDLIWELQPEHKRGTFHLVPHHANYLLVGRYSDDTNTQPDTPAPGHSLDKPQSVDALEAKFQFSVKVKAWENIFGDNGDLWLAYTQQSNWQVYNNLLSSPFRETNYQPEAILALRTEWSLFGWRWRMLNFGVAHQSNGQDLPLSRSWNRAYAQFGFDRGNVSVVVRPWVRLSENDAKDDNPDITDYLGSGDLRIAYTRGGHVYSALGRYSDTGKRGALQLDWAFPISGSLKGYVQATSGYGESLLDYNHSQNTIGIGLLLVPWK